MEVAVRMRVYGSGIGAIWEDVRDVMAAHENDSKRDQDHLYIFHGVWVSTEDDKEGDWM
jgi:hypothetical protein